MARSGMFLSIKGTSLVPLNGRWEGAVRWHTDHPEEEEGEALPDPLHFFRAN